MMLVPKCWGIDAADGDDGVRDESNGDGGHGYESLSAPERCSRQDLVMSSSAEKEESR